MSWEAGALVSGGGAGAEGRCDVGGAGPEASQGGLRPDLQPPTPGGHKGVL